MVDIPYFDFYLLSIVGALEIALGILFLIRYQRTAPSVIFGLLIICVGFWVFANGLSFTFHQNSLANDLANRLTFVFALFIFPLFDLYIHLFPYSPNLRRVRIVALELMPAIILSCLILFSKTFVIRFLPDKFSTPIFGHDYWIYASYLIGMFFFVMTQAFRKRNELDGIHRKAMTYLLVGIIISGTIGIIFQIILPFFFHTFILPSLGPASSLVLAGLIASLVLRK